MAMFTDADVYYLGSRLAESYMESEPAVHLPYRHHTFPSFSPYAAQHRLFTGRGRGVPEKPPATSSLAPSEVHQPTLSRVTSGTTLGSKTNSESRDLELQAPSTDGIDPSKSLPIWNRKPWLLVCVVLLVCLAIGLGVGLGVGLTQK